MNPAKRSKPGKIRPVIVVQSTDTIKAGSPGIAIVPLTTQLMEENILRLRLKPSKQLLLKQTSDCLIDQVHTIDRYYFLEEIGFISDDQLKKIQEGIKFLLGI
jgi:mRNA interferase MazF